MLRPNRWSGDTQRTVVALTICAGLAISSQFTDFFKGKSKPEAGTNTPRLSCAEDQTYRIIDHLLNNTGFMGTILAVEKNSLITVSDSADKIPSIGNPLVIVCNGVIKAYLARSDTYSVDTIPASRAELSNDSKPGQEVSLVTEQEIILPKTLHLTKTDSVPVFVNQDGRTFGSEF